MISVIPLVVAALFEPISEIECNPETGYQYAADFLNVLWKHFNGKNQFIYAVSFITPILYMIYERYILMQSHVESGKRTSKDLRKLPPGFGWIMFWAVLVFVFAAFAFATSATRPIRTSTTFLDVVSKYTVLLVYLFSLLCWYMTILDSSMEPAQAFTDTIRKEEDELAATFSRRISNKEDTK